mmetsp:Transcript_34378/g.79484  ORF Transcript_34378/g.79484 Transcript_34378/m.79484 type:complete len:133 (-) Transcript_34378:66-464(-)
MFPTPARKNVYRAANGSVPRRRIRRVISKGKENEEIPSLKEFMRRSEILSQYRSLLRCASKLEDPHKSDTLAEIRSRYLTVQNEKPTSLTASMAFTEGNRQLSLLQSLTGSRWTEKSDPGTEVGQGWPWERK